MESNPRFCEINKGLLQKEVFLSEPYSTDRSFIFVNKTILTPLQIRYMWYRIDKFLNWKAISDKCQWFLDEGEGSEKSIICKCYNKTNKNTRELKIFSYLWNKQDTTNVQQYMLLHCLLYWYCILLMFTWNKNLRNWEKEENREREKDRLKAL